jgi:hypothetical protein
MSPNHQGRTTRNGLRLSVVATLCTFSVVGIASAPAHAADAMAIVNVSLQGDTQTPGDLSAALRRGFTAGGFAVGNLPLDSSADNCNQLDCLTLLAKKYKADLLAWATVQSSPQTYEVQIRVVSASTGESMTVDRIKCGADDLCPPMPQTVQRLAKEAARKVRSRISDLVAPPMPEPIVLATPTPTVPSQTGPAFAPPRVYAVEDSSSPALTPGPLWLTGGSVVALGISGILFANSNVGSSPHDYKAAAIGVGIVGLVGLGTATAWMLLQAPPQATTSQAAVAPFADQQSVGLAVHGHWQ